MVNCPECGERVSPEDHFCTNCGYDLSDMEWEKKTLDTDIVITTTNSVQGKEIEEYLGIVAGEAMMGANIVKDFTAGIRNIVGGRSGQYEKEIAQGRKEALRDLEEEAENLDADAVVGATFDYEEMSEGMLWITATGTAVKLKNQ